MENPLLGMLQPWTIAAIALGPFVFQWLKWAVLTAGILKAEPSKQWAAGLNAAAILGSVVWYGIQAGASPLVIAGQFAIGLFVTEQVYKRGVEPMANSSNPIVPQTATKAEAKLERET